ncbi:hypothetical protein V8F20_003866 [Naviculisporaceae sp. PSN 640]
MDFRQHGRVSRTGFTILKDSPNAEFDIVLVHGLGGHPYKTWTYPRPKSDDGPSLTTENTHNITETHRAAEEKPRLGQRVLRRFLGRRKWASHKEDETSTEITRPRGSAAPTAVVPAKPATEVYWPLHILSTEEWCKNARVMVYGYESQVTRGYANSNKNNFFAHAKDLLYSLLREKVPRRPIIFVAHSLGGLLVKEVLRRSHESEEYEVKDIVKSAIGVIFMGTPHRGSPGLAELGDTVRRMISTLFRVDTNSSLLQTLGSGSNLELELGREAFLVLWRTYDFRVKTFQEAYGIIGVNVGPLNEKVVSDLSSTLDDPREHAETISANHMDMCRFKNREDPGYRKLSSEINGVMKSYKKHDMAITSEGRDFLKSLYFPEMYQREKNIQRALENTCNWLFATPEYKAWRDRIDMGQNHGMLWIKGKPGAGKSVLVKEISRRFKDHAQAQALEMKLRTSAAFFFNARGTQRLEKTALGVYRSLLHQVLQKDLVALSHLSRRYMEIRSYQGSVDWHEEDLQEFLMLVFATPESRPSTLFVDAMDECDESEVRELLGFFKRLAKKAYECGADLRICFSSRHYPNVSIPGCPEVVVEHHNRQDILQYIENEAEEDDNIWELQDDILAKSNGIFLWVILVVTLLKSTGRGKSLKWLKHKLDEIPSQIEALFHTMFEAESEDQVQAIRLMHIILYSKRTLTLAEIRIALAFSGAPYSSIEHWKESMDFLETPQKVHAMIIDLSRGLLERVPMGSRTGRVSSHYDTYDALNNQFTTSLPDERSHFLEKTTYQFIHETVREFFLRGEGFDLLAGSKSGKRSDPAGPGHTTLAVACVNYLNTSELASLSEQGLLPRPLRDSEFPFLDYINTAIFDHIEAAEQHGSSQVDLIALIVENNLIQRLKTLQSSLFGVSSGSDLMFAAAELGLEHVLKRMVRMEFDMNFPCPTARRYTLLAAVGKKPLSSRGAYGSVKTFEAVKFLLSEGANPNVTTADQQTLLHLAAKHSPALVKEALAFGLDVNANDRYMETPLHKASTLEWDNRLGREVIKLLVSHGADINSADIEGDTPLHKAGLVGNSAMFSALLDAGADRLLRNKKGWVPRDEAGVPKISSDDMILGSDQEDDGADGEAYKNQDHQVKMQDSTTKAKLFRRARPPLSTRRAPVWTSPGLETAPWAARRRWYRADQVQVKQPKTEKAEDEMGQDHES